MTDDKTNLWSMLGIKSDTLSRVRLGQGVVGRTSTVALGLMAVLGVTAYNMTNEYLLGLLALIAVAVFAWFAQKAFGFAKENPAAALLEGADFVQHKQIEVAAKGVKLPRQKARLVTDPKSPQLSFDVGDK